MKGARRGMALAITIGVVALVTILAVATLSLSGRLRQNSTLSIRDVQLDAGAAFGLAAATDEWRARGIGRLAVGSSVSFAVTAAAADGAVRTTVTRVGSDLFWVVADASAGGARRSENVVLRSGAPSADLLLEEDSTNVTSLGSISVDSLARMAESQRSSGTIMSPATGFIHVSGDAILTAGSGGGILIIDGRLVISGALSYEGIIIARGGVSVVQAGARVVGMVRASGSPPLLGTLTVDPAAPVVQSVLLQAVMPTPVRGRRWAELY